jgi:thymidylate synthase ThyX
MKLTDTLAEPKWLTEARLRWAAEAQWEAERKLAAAWKAEISAEWLKEVIEAFTPKERTDGGVPWLRP